MDRLSLIFATKSDWKSSWSSLRTDRSSETASLRVWFLLLGTQWKVSECFSWLQFLNVSHGFNFWRYHLRFLAQRFSDIPVGSHAQVEEYLTKQINAHGDPWATFIPALDVMTEADRQYQNGVFDLDWCLAPIQPFLDSEFSYNMLDVPSYNIGRWCRKD